MYRVRAEAISGKNVYAGGKWLRCIGNKNVHVGELVWTDGRCVYGNHHVPQQPLVITAPPQANEIIPIFEKYYPVDKDYACFSLDSRNGKSSLEAEWQNIKGYDFSLMANNSNGFYYLYDTAARNNYPHGFIGEYNNKTILNEYYRGERLAVNIACDDNGNFFAINEHFSPILNDLYYGYGSETPSGPYRWVWYDVSNVFDKVEIQKGSEIVHEIDLKPFIEETKNACHDTRPFVFEQFCHYWATVSRADYVVRSYIENENNWAFFVACYAMKFIEFDESNRKPAGYPHEFEILVPCENNYLQRIYYFDSKGTCEVVVDLYEDEYFPDPYSYGEMRRSKEEKYLNQIKFPLGKGYYYKQEEWDYMGTIFSPQNNPITNIFLSGGHFSICPLSKGNQYLLSDGQILYLVHDGQNQKIELKTANHDYNRYTLNTRLVPIKKKRHWAQNYAVVSAPGFNSISEVII